MLYIQLFRRYTLTHAMHIACLQDQMFCREAEVIHSRWAMLGVLGLIIPDVLGAPLYMLPELGTARLLPFTIIVVVAFGGLEIYRVQSILQGQDLNSRVYPGGKSFDPLGLASRQQPGTKRASNPGDALCVHQRLTTAQLSSVVQLVLQFEV